MTGVQPKEIVTAKARSDETFTGIQALRAVAALVVVYGHSINLLQRQHDSVAAGLERVPGAIGVDLFFVISGFVITVSSGGLLRRPRPARIFLWRRVLRVVPLYWMLTAAKLLLVAWWPAVSAHEAPSTWNMVASFLFVPSRNAAGEVRPVIPVGWTLSFEALFYILFALALLRRERFARVLLPMTCAIGLVGLFRTPAWPAVTSMMDPIIFEFVAGVVIALMVKRNQLPGKVLGWVLLAIGGVGLALSSPSGGSTSARALLWGAPAAVVVLGCAALEPTMKRRLPRWLLLLGSASYAIYLVQTFVLPAVGMAFDQAHRRGLAQMVTDEKVEVVLGVVLTTLAGVVVHLLVERPGTELLKRRFGTERIAPVARSS